MRTELQELKKEYQRKLRVMGYSSRTISAYTHFFMQFCANHNPKRASITDIENWLLTITGYSAHNQAINALRFYYKCIQYSDLKLKRIKRPRKQFKLPEVLDKQTIINGIESCTNIKHKCMMLLLYGSGLRLSELLNLKIADVDGERTVLKINQGKGRKDRQTIVSEDTLELLRQYYKKYRPRIYLFNGQDFMKYSATSVRKIVRRYLNTHPHTLRHSFATHLIESGVDISYVSKLLGHRKIETTMIYNHVAVEKVECLV